MRPEEEEPTGPMPDREVSRVIVRVIASDGKTVMKEEVVRAGEIHGFGYTTGQYAPWLIEVEEDLVVIHLGALKVEEDLVVIHLGALS